MDRFKDFKQRGSDVTFTMEGTRREAFLLCNAMAYQVPTLAVGQVTFYYNDSSLKPEEIALRFGLIPLRNEGSPYQDGQELKVDVVGKPVTAADIPDYVPPWGLEENDDPVVVRLRRHERLTVVLRLEEGSGMSHVKFRPIANFQVKSNGDDTIQTINLVSCGMFKPKTLVARALDYLDDAEKFVTDRTYLYKAF